MMVMKIRGVAKRGGVMMMVMKVYCVAQHEGTIIAYGSAVQGNSTCMRVMRRQVPGGPEQKELHASAAHPGMEGVEGKK